MRLQTTSFMQLTPDIIFGSVSILFGAALYAFSVVAYRSQSKEIRPLAIASIKMWVALGFMLLLALIPLGINPLAVGFDQVLYLSGSVILGAVIGDTFYLISQERIGVSYAFPIAMSFPILTYFLTVIFLGEPLLLSRLIGVFIAVAGIIILALEQESDANDKWESAEIRRIDWIGISLAILTAVLYATGTTILQIGVEGVDALSANFIRMVVGSIAFVPMVLVARVKGMPIPTRKATKLVAIAGLFGMAIGSIFYVTGVKYAGAAIASVLASTAPLWAVPISVFYLKERLTRLAAFGVLATIIGAILVVIGI
ncbi:MAG: DMT family transporter [Candidatus Thorarchaeota archaeon]